MKKSTKSYAHRQVGFAPIAVIIIAAAVLALAGGWWRWQNQKLKIKNQNTERAIRQTATAENVENIDHDLTGANFGDSIHILILNMPTNTKEVKFYHSQSPQGPWLKISDDTFVESRGENLSWGHDDLVDGTKSDFYYKAEAISSFGIILKTYGVLQVPKYTGSGSDTFTWKTYRNEKYGFELKYPNTWEIQDYKIKQGLSSDTVGFVPQNLNDFSECAQNARDLRENYKSYNPFSGYEQYSDDLAKAECGIHLRIETNTVHYSLREFLNRDFSNEKSFQAVLSELQIATDGGIQKAVSAHYTFEFDSGFEGGVKAISGVGPQYIIRTENFVIFIGGSHAANDKNYGNIMTNIFQSIKFTK